MAGRDLSLEEFKERLPLAEIVGRYVKLTRRGREQVGLCPFHKEKTPSFNVVEEKGFYHCFGCGAHGTAIDFVMAVEGLGFGDALERIADLTGIPAPRRAAAAKPEPDQRLYAANAAAAAWFQSQLTLPAGRDALAYLERRGLGREAVRDFGLGFAPDERAALKRALAAQGFTEDELLAAGILARPEDGGESFDRFRHRVMFPIAEERGRVVGFGGRALGEARAKYLNTSETELFRKGELLYNLHRAVGPARERRELILAEGYIDVIALSQAGFAHAVAPLGTAVTERQLALLWRFAEAPIVCLDGDRAGLAAALRAAERALPLMRGGRTLRFAVLPDGEDPDSYLRRHGAAALGAVLSKAHTLSQMIWQLETQGRRFDTPEARAALSRRLRGLARLAGDPDLRAGLLDQFRALQDQLVPRSARGQKRPPARASGWEGVGAARLEAALGDPQLLRELRLILPVLAFPSILLDVEDEFDKLPIENALVERMRNEIIYWYNSDAEPSRSDLRTYLAGIPDLKYLMEYVERNPLSFANIDQNFRRSCNSYLMKAAILLEGKLAEERLFEDDLEAAQISFKNISDLLNHPGESEEVTHTADFQFYREELDRTLTEVSERVAAKRRMGSAENES
ncbi:MAG TPA: DNA primase [Geminicoccaceae bacterium]|nr:DNA primase [Geminicoccaceae bacterium]